MYDLPIERQAPRGSTTRAVLQNRHTAALKAMVKFSSMTNFHVLRCTVTRNCQPPKDTPDPTVELIRFCSRSYTTEQVAMDSVTISQTLSVQVTFQPSDFYSTQLCPCVSASSRIIPLCECGGWILQDSCIHMKRLKTSEVASSPISCRLSALPICYIPIGILLSDPFCPQRNPCICFSSEKVTNSRFPQRSSGSSS